AVVHGLRHIEFHTAEQVYQFYQHFQTDGHVSVDGHLQLVGHQFAQGRHIVVAVGTLGLGNAVDAVVAGNAAVGGDHQVTGDLQHLQLARFVVEMDVKDHIGHAVVDAGIVGGTGRQ